MLRVGDVMTVALLAVLVLLGVSSCLGWGEHQRYEETPIPPTVYNHPEMIP